MAEQNYSNHTRWYPLNHFVIAPLTLAYFVYEAVMLYRHFQYERIWAFVVAIVLVLLSVSARLQALKAQDRVIRLEERLRFGALLSPDLARKAADLPVSLIIGMRFASDEELHEIAQAAVDGKFANQGELKKAIKTWKADNHRV